MTTEQMEELLALYRNPAVTSIIDVLDPSIGIFYAASDEEYLCVLEQLIGEAIERGAL